jgi:hypothetical protein
LGGNGGAVDIICGVGESMESGADTVADDKGDDDFDTVIVSPIVSLEASE